MSSRVFIPRIVRHGITEPNRTVIMTLSLVIRGEQLCYEIFYNIVAVNEKRTIPRRVFSHRHEDRHRWSSAEKLECYPSGKKNTKQRKLQTSVVNASTWKKNQHKSFTFAWLLSYKSFPRLSPTFLTVIKSVQHQPGISWTVTHMKHVMLKYFTSL